MHPHVLPVKLPPACERNERLLFGIATRRGCGMIGAQIREEGIPGQVERAQGGHVGIEQRYGFLAFCPGLKSLRHVVLPNPDLEVDISPLVRQSE